MLGHSFGQASMSLALLFLSFILVPVTWASPPVSVKLQTSWNAAQLPLEILETAALENNSIYWSLLDSLADPKLAKLETEKEYYDEAVRILDSEFLKDPVMLGSFELGLSLHVAAPKIEAYYQFYQTSVVPSLGSGYQEGCSAWVYWRGRQICDTESLESTLKEVSTGERSVKVKELPFDHVYNPIANADTAVLYADIEDEQFKVFHDVLKKAAQDGVVRYILRYKPVVGSKRGQSKDRPLVVSGYGVELMLKRTDYIVIDDRDIDSEQSEKPAQAKSEDPSDEESPVITPLHASELGQLGYQAVQLIINSSSPLDTLQKLSQDFPSQSAKIAATQVDESVVDVLRQNNQVIPSGENLFWINGMHVGRDKVEAFNLLTVMRRERGLINSLRKLGLSNIEAIEYLSHEKIAEKVESGTKNRFDFRDDIEGGNVITWFNDIEKDTRYIHWSRDLGHILKPLYPGQLHNIRKNIHHAVFVLDLSRKEDLSRLVEEITTLIQRQLPIRFGIVVLPVEGDTQSEQIARIFKHVVDTYGRSVAVKFAQDLLVAQDKDLTSKVKSLFSSIYNNVNAAPNHEKLPYEQVITSGSEILDNARSWAQRLGVSAKTGAIFANGQIYPKDDSWMNKLGVQLAEDVGLLQKAVYEGDIYIDEDILEYLLREAPKSRNEYIFPAEAGSVKFVNLPEILPTEGIIYVQGQREDGPGVENATVIWVVEDFDSITGIEALRNAVTYQGDHPHITLGLVHNPGRDGGNLGVSSLLYHLANSGVLDGPAGFQNLQKVTEELTALSDENTDGGDSIAKILGIKASDWRIPDDELARRFWSSGIEFARSVEFAVGQRGLIVNGRIVGPFRDGDSFTPEDFEALQLYEARERIGPSISAAKEMDIFTKLKDDGALLAAQLTSVVSVSSTSDLPPGIFDTPTYSRRRSYELLDPKVGVVEYGSIDGAVFQIVITLDPLSEAAQKWSSIIKVLSQMNGVYLRVYLNPRAVTSELPIKRFYRYVISKPIEFEDDGAVKDSLALFSAVPEDPLFTMGFEVPPAWVVVSKDCIYDLDNIVLSKLSPSAREKGIAAVYELKYILIDGHARDVTYGNAPPRGIQIILGTEKNPYVVDTIVMANLGYLQLKANPGVWILDLKDGPSKEVFKLQSVGSEGWISRDVDTIGTDIFLTSFQGITIYPRVVRREGMESVDVLEPDERPKSFLDQAGKFVGEWKSKLFGGAASVEKHPSNQAEINIFTLASGHLYERFIYIMVQSVLKHTHSTVKFWFIENFLSPSFKKFIPLLAEELGFEYELVTYKWPYWLRHQREKQREIWGYKILFLDLLFPLDLDKVIFVDADQIVRTDLKKLVDLDLHGAPYGYTPMCDSRPEVEGFRFWKQGFWKDWLKGLPYHISALYVVDLKRFRQLAAGDRLRGTYQSLSADKNSLANLDQDLPNYAQHHIPIFSLPQEWLWCETWCSLNTLETAKTIDLCNDPLTKTPKLVRAKNIPEWTTYDRQVAEMAQRLLKKDAAGKGGANETVDESMFVQIDSSPAKDPVVSNEEGKTEERVKDEL